jgi:eukaryotic-like serine/threonine-protein kinase
VRSSSARAPTGELPDGVYALTSGGQDLPEGIVTSRAPTEHHGFASTSAIRPSLTEVYGPGSLVAGKYELVRKLGEGGMGAVWVAKNLTLDVHVALKLLRAGYSEDVPGAAERMQQEARAAASIAHPSIIQVFDFGKSELGVPFIAMELLNGESLAGLLLRKKKLKATRAVQTLLPIIDALAVAHEHGIVHRDLKPDNVFLTRLLDGKLVPKILDFGIAKLEQKVAPKLTLEGTVLGSPAYMAPEQARGESQIDARADIWALGVALYETVTGVCPFTGQNYQALLWAILGTEPEPLARHGVDEPELWAIVARCLSKNRDNRWQDMRALGGALAAYLMSRGVAEDITKSPLGAWLTPRVAGAEPLLSMFPSSATPETIRSRTHGGAAAAEAPLVLEVVAATPAAVPVLEQATRALGPRMGLFGPVSSEQQPADAAHERTTQKRARPLSSWRGRHKFWFAAAGLGAVLAFALAAWRSPPEASEEETRSLAPREAKPEREAPVVPRVTRTPEPEAVEAPPEPTPAFTPRAVPQPARPARPSVRPSRERQAPRPAELKNPFADARSEAAANGGATRTKTDGNAGSAPASRTAKVKAQ